MLGKRPAYDDLEWSLLNPFWNVHAIPSFSSSSSSCYYPQHQHTLHTYIRRFYAEFRLFWITPVPALNLAHTRTPIQTTTFALDLTLPRSPCLISTPTRSLARSFSLFFHTTFPSYTFTIVIFIQLWNLLYTLLSVKWSLCVYSSLMWFVCPVHPFSPPSVCVFAL